MTYNKYYIDFIQVLCYSIIEWRDCMSSFQEYLDAELSKVSFSYDEHEEAEDDLICYEFANLLQSTRKKLKISQKELAKITGIQQSSISKIESGKYNPSILLIQRIANGLGKKVIIRLE